MRSVSRQASDRSPPRSAIRFRLRTTRLTQAMSQSWQIASGGCSPRSTWCSKTIVRDFGAAIRRCTSSGAPLTSPTRDSMAVRLRRHLAPRSSSDWAATRSRRARDPGFSAFRRAARAAIVIPLAFAFADVVLRAPQSLVFVMFGCFSLLVISDFGGSRRPRALAYLMATLVGAAFVALGTLVSTSPWLPGVLMFIVGFAISFSRIFGGYFAAANLGILLAFVIARPSPAPPTPIPARVGGWAIAGLISTVAAIVLWPRFERVMTNNLAAKALVAVADLVEGMRPGGDDGIFPGLPEAARSAVQAARGAYAMMGKRPIAPARRDRAFVQLLIECERILDIIDRPFNHNLAPLPPHLPHATPPVYPCPPPPPR